MAEASSHTKDRRHPSAAFMKPVKPDEKLATIIGAEPLARTDVTRKLWEYIRGHDLQDPQNKTFIKADENLKQVFNGKDRVSMFEMTKLVFEHVA
jgi:chromatin remodeling complex protein RSC6